MGSLIVEVGVLAGFMRVSKIEKKGVNASGESRGFLGLSNSILRNTTKKQSSLRTSLVPLGTPFEIQPCLKISCAVAFLIVDTKDYYIPHTPVRGT
jgi:hypothetical protein